MNRNGISSLGDNGICIPLSTSSYDFSESERYDEQYNERQEKQPMDNTYTYRAKRKDWQEWVKSCQYVTGNMVTLGRQIFLGNTGVWGDELYIDDFTEIDKDTIEPVIEPAIDKKKEVLTKEEILIKVHSELTDLSILQLIKNLQPFVMHVIMIMIHYLNGIKSVNYKLRAVL